MGGGSDDKRQQMRTLPVWVKDVLQSGANRCKPVNRNGTSIDNRMYQRQAKQCHYERQCGAAHECLPPFV